MTAAASDEAGAIIGLAGVIVWTSPERFTSMRRFYAETLGLEPHSDRDGHVNFAWVEPGAEVDELRLTIATHTRVRGRTLEPTRLMLNLGVRDIHAAVERLRKAGVAFSRPPEQESWGGWIATFEDPDGNTLQLLQPTSGDDNTTERND